MDDIVYREEALMRRKPDASRLAAFGFVDEGGVPTCRVAIADGALTAVVRVEDGRFHLTLTDDFGGEYTLHRASGAAGAFVGRVREEYAALLDRLDAECTFRAAKAAQAAEMLAYAAAEWDELPDCPFAEGDSDILRRTDSGKWYAVFMEIPRRKLGQGSDAPVTVVNMKMDPARIPETVDHAAYFPAYHMNKTHWITAVLDGTAPTAELCAHLAASRMLVGRKGKKHDTKSS